jgi:hypothetical protein
MLSFIRVIMVMVFLHSKRTLTNTVPDILPLRRAQQTFNYVDLMAFLAILTVPVQGYQFFPYAFIFIFIFFKTRSHAASPGMSQTYYIAGDDLKLLILLPPSPKWLDHRCVQYWELSQGLCKCQESTLTAALSPVSLPYSLLLCC